MQLSNVIRRIATFHQSGEGVWVENSTRFPCQRFRSETWGFRIRLCLGHFILLTVSADEIPPVYISEIMPVNRSTIESPGGDYPDWIELHNSTSETLSLDGWFLTDDEDDLRKSRLTDVSIEADGYRVLFATGTNIPSNAEAAFRLDAGGEYLALVSPDGSVAHALDTFPRLYADESYGLETRESELVPGYFKRATPGAANRDSRSGRVADTVFSIDRGFHTEPFDVRIQTSTPGATIYYTTDGRAPGPGNVFTGPIGRIYDAASPVAINTTTVLRAAAYHEDLMPTNIDTQTYVFPMEVTRQSDAPEGFPDQWQGADYGMDQDVRHLPLIAGDPGLNEVSAREVIADSLLALPTLSLVLDAEDMFGRTRGIYHNTEERGMDWEKPVSVEWINPGDESGFQIDAGLRMQGFTSRNPSRNPKHSLRLLFREIYGDTKLRYPVFGPLAATDFDTLVLRSNAQDAWVYDSAGNRVGQFVRDEWNRRIQLAMGHPAAHGTWVHLYINGLYWGVYNPTERPDASFLASYLGGAPENYDVIKNHEELLDGSFDSYAEVRSEIQINPNSFASGYQDFTNNANYFALLGRRADGTMDPTGEALIDVSNLIDYMIHNMYSAAQDWPGNFYMGYNRRPATGGWRFFSWDNEHGLKGNVGENRTLEHRRDEDSPTKFHHPLRNNAEYRLLFADHLHRAFFNGGPLFVDAERPEWNPDSPENNRPAALWMEVTGTIKQALIAESARWGDYRRTTPYTVDDDFIPLRQNLLDNWFPRRSAIVLEQFRDQGLYPDLEAPRFSRPGGYVGSGATLTMTSRDLPSIFAPGGVIYYTTDGTDPRLVGGDVNHAHAMKYEPGEALVLDRSVTFRARLLKDGEWSAFSEVEYRVGLSPASRENIRISEIHYHPANPTEEEAAAGFEDDDFEFLELWNPTEERVDLDGLTVAGGVRFVFPSNSILEAGQRIVVVRNSDAFAMRYGDEPDVAGEFSPGKLNNGGETIWLVDKGSETIWRVTYDDKAPWPTKADGAGHSLVWHGRDPVDPTNWSASGEIHGTPGRGEENDGVLFSEWLDGRDPLADPDGDGYVLLHDFVLGRDIGRSTGALRIDANPSRIRVEATIRQNTPGVEVVLERSDAGQTWVEAKNLPKGTAERGNGLETVFFEFDLGETNMGFYRLRFLVKEVEAKAGIEGK